jgi:dTDP-4-dehydrorhamnose reductase
VKDNKKKILILGSTGMLGSEVLKVFSDLDNYKIFTNLRNLKQKKTFKINNLNKITFFKFDAKINNINELKRYITKDTIIINCIGIIKPHINESSQDSVFNAIQINSSFPHQLNTKFSQNKIYQMLLTVFFLVKRDYILRMIFMTLKMYMVKLKV